MALSWGFCLGKAASAYNAQQFSEVFHAFVGDGICTYGRQFALTISGFTAILAPGFALVHGRWLKNDAPYQLALPPSGNYADRYDAIAVKVDHGTRQAKLEVLVDITPTAVMEHPSLIRNDQEYSVILYFVHIKRGATELVLENVTDVRGNNSLCGYVVPMAAESAHVLYIHQFLTSGIDEAVARLIGLSNAAIRKADAAIEDIDAAIHTTSTAEIGEVMVSKSQPTPAYAWLLCDGGRVPGEYAELSAMLDGNLPTITPADSRLRVYIYGGLSAT